MTIVTALGAARGRLLAGMIALALAVALIPVPPARAGTSFTFSGGGYGHSVGLSQFGAYGMAREGYTWSEILGHYFTGTTAGPVDAAVAARPLWVNLQVEQSAVTFVVRATGTSLAAPVTFTSSGGTLTAESGHTVRINRSGATCTIAAPAGTVSGDCSIDAEWDGRGGNPTTALVIDGCFLTNWNLTTGSRQQPCTYARGAIHLRPDNNTATLAVSLEIAMEDYILGISEMPYFWGDQGGAAALEAQAVAARSYAYSRLLDRGTPDSRPWCWCQVYDTPIDQNYVGWGHGTQAWIDAVRRTADQVLYHPGTTRNGVQVPVATFYSSSTFGATENSEDGFTARVAYLRSVDDHWAGLSGVGNGNYRWTRTFSDTQLASILPGMNSVTGAVITRCSVSGAALEITFSGSGGPKVFHARQLRSLLGLRSQQIYAINGAAPCSETATTTTTTAPDQTTTTLPADTTTTTAPDQTTTTAPDQT
ncbi:MAG TPA: SpoIID/LytB domain-containing protein, partial [Acidimicrobiia bacterium]|nr:SpoIID/LytB domain-containing protein [Acidimicrobiia bacterium]